MGVRIEHHDYGKSRVRLLKVRRRGEVHDVRDLVVQVLAEGDFAEAYTAGDNRRVLPTDTIKNTVYAVARSNAVDRIERFGQDLADHFLKTHAPMVQVSITIEEKEWLRVQVPGPDGRVPHPHAFVQGAAERSIAEIVATRDGARVTSGIDDLRVLKTTGSGFEGYASDAWTTLEPTKDRVFATIVRARWTWKTAPKDYAISNDRVRGAFLERFAVPYSPSAQETLFQMGKAALDRCPEIERITLSLPNLHHLLANLKPLGLDNPNDVFIPTDEPHGLIEATMVRD